MATSFGAFARCLVWLVAWFGQRVSKFGVTSIATSKHQALVTRSRQDASTILDQLPEEALSDEEVALRQAAQRSAVSMIPWSRVGSVYGRAYVANVGCFSVKQPPKRGLTKGRQVSCEPAKWGGFSFWFSFEGPTRAFQESQPWPGVQLNFQILFPALPALSLVHMCFFRVRTFIAEYVLQGRSNSCFLLRRSIRISSLSCYSPKNL